uniref:MedDCM-OCT-S40-C199-cds10 n=1 Tax=Candidatus Actinomarina minuta TaxID=1389454 RepID=S5DLA0_9ACTN|nr:MedDCM-OCT-S40-C199-cds10 [Candidatus Actinomarina minuta]
MKVSLSSTAEYSSKAAESIKDLKPNAADVLITSIVTSMVTDLGVVAPTSSGLLTFYDGKTNQSHTVDGYFVSPKNFKGNDHEEHRVVLTYGGYVETCKGANTFAIPGIYKILDFLYNNYASLPLNKLLEFPINIAKKGFKLTQPTKDYFQHALKPMFMWHDYSRMILENISQDLENGIVKLNKLSDSLEHLSNEGFNDFYIGDISKEILKTIVNEGGHATSEDFGNYKLIEDNKFNFKYKNLNLTGHSGPSIGGLMVLKYIDELSTGNNIEALIDVYKNRKDKYEFFGDRQSLINQEIINLTKSSSTIQVNTSDEMNNHFSITFSSGYGSGVLCQNTGMYFNNSLGEIELNPQGFMGDTKGDRLISNMSPIIIQSKNGITTIGSPGADRISSAIAQVLLNYSKNNNWRQAIDEPRFHVNGDGSVRGEPGSIETYKDITITDKYDMYFGGVCVSGLNKDVFSFGDKRRGDTSWIS